MKLKNAISIKYPPRRAQGIQHSEQFLISVLKEAAVAAAVNDVPVELLVGDDMKRCEEEVPAAEGGGLVRVAQVGWSEGGDVKRHLKSGVMEEAAEEGRRVQHVESVAEDR
jgi:hypothetical protein